MFSSRKHVHESDLAPRPLEMHFKIKPYLQCTGPSSKHQPFLSSHHDRRASSLGSPTSPYQFSSENTIGVSLTLLKRTLLLPAVGLRASCSRRSPEKSSQQRHLHFTSSAMILHHGLPKLMDTLTNKILFYERIISR